MEREAQEERRDPRKWPFAQDSIWNTPIGDGAVYVPAEIRQTERAGMTIDEDLIVMRPEAPMTSLYHSDVGWSNGPDRCTNYDANRKLFEVPIPAEFVVSPDTWDGTKPNSALAVLMPDGETVIQTQPFARCEAGGLGTTMTSQVPDQNLYGDGIRGAHGGSGLSAIGGTLRVGELVPGGSIHHALKVNLFGKLNFFQASGEADGKPGYRWPAVKADTGYNNPNSGNYYGGTNPALQMGSLLAIHPTEDLSTLEGNSLDLQTEAALILARAFQDYGAYVVDNTAWDVYALVTEWGPDGRVNDEVEVHWGHTIKQRSQDTTFSDDMDRLFLNLFVVDNNSPDSVGGGGTPRAELAPPFIGEDSDEFDFGVSDLVLVNADTGEDLIGFECSPLPCKEGAVNFSVRAVTYGQVHSVRFWLNGPLTVTRVDSRTPFALWGNKREVWKSREFPPGEYTLRAQAFSEKRAQGEAGDSFEISFTF